DHTEIGLGELEEFSEFVLYQSHGPVRYETTVVAERGAVLDLYDTMDTNVRPGQRIPRTEPYRQLVAVGHIAGDCESPDGQLLHGVVLVVADDEHAVLTTATQQSPDLTPSHHCASRSAISLLASMSAWSSASCSGLRRRRNSPYAWAAARWRSRRAAGSTRRTASVTAADALPWLCR